MINELCAVITDNSNLISGYVCNIVTVYKQKVGLLNPDICLLK